MAQGVEANEGETVGVTLRVTANEAAGGVLTAKQAPDRPGTAPALGLRAGNDVFFHDADRMKGAIR